MGRTRSSVGGAKATPKSTPKPTPKAVKRKTKDDDSSTPAKMQRGESLNTKLTKAIEAVQTSATKKKVHRVDSFAPMSKNTKVLEDYACMLNQTNISHNNNKFYLVQALQHTQIKFSVFTRWGRVGESGQMSDTPAKNKDQAIVDFEKKFKAKTANNWNARDNFTAKAGKYTLLDMGDEDEDEDEEEIEQNETIRKDTLDSLTYAKSCLDARTFQMLKLIFNEDMFVDQMTNMNLDVRKMPLGKLSKQQISKGLEVLIEIERAVEDGKTNTALADLSSKFYTLVPHSFGRTTPPVMNSKAIIDQKKEVMMILSDIELTMSLRTKEKKTEDIHPIDKRYQELGCKLSWLEKSSDEFELIETFAASSPDGSNKKLIDAWRVDRAGEAERFAAHDAIKFRKLLWHGTNVAVVAAILNSGLRIMPHSGGLVGRGIYFASDHSKSAGYVGVHWGTFEGEKNVGFMFLTEVALGNMNIITKSNGSLRSAPKGYESVVARGSTEPDPKKDVVRQYDGHKVVIPVGKPKKQSNFSKSYFSKSEYLVYKESQARIRYVLKFCWGYND